MGEKPPVYTELDARQNDGHTVQLLWDPESGETAIRIEQYNPHKVIQFQVLGEKALAAFNHPYAHAPANLLK